MSEEERSITQRKKNIFFHTRMKEEAESIRQLHTHAWLKNVHWGNYAWLLVLTPALPQSLPVPGSNNSPDLCVCVHAWCNTFCTHLVELHTSVLPNDSGFEPAETCNCSGVFDLAACSWKSFREWGNKSARVTEHEREHNITAPVKISARVKSDRFSSSVVGRQQLPWSHTEQQKLHTVVLSGRSTHRVWDKRRLMKHAGLRTNYRLVNTPSTWGLK